MDTNVKRDRRLHVVIDMTYPNKSTTGTNVYARCLLAALESTGCCEVVPLAAPLRWSRPASEGNLLTGARNQVWMQMVLPARLAALQADVLHAPAFLSPLTSPCPVVLTVHDTIYLSHPEHYDYKWRLYARLLVGPAVRRAAVVITVSEYSKGRIVDAYRVPPERVRVIHHGVGKEFKPTLSRAEIEAVRRRYGLGHLYCLFVGGSERRKNLAALVEAVARLKATGRYPSLQLALVGPRGSGWPEVAAAIERGELNGTVVCPGYVREEDLPFLYAGAKLFVFPSLLEGFGMPLIEAMACGTPVVAAPCPPVPEVVNGAAVLAESPDAEALAAAMDRVLSDSNLASDLKERGLARASAFSWERAARETIALYEQVAPRHATSRD